MEQDDDRIWDLHRDSLLRASDTCRQSWMFAVGCCATIWLLLGPTNDWISDATVLGMTVPKFIGCLALWYMSKLGLYACYHALRRGNAIVAAMSDRPSELSAVLASGAFLMHRETSGTLVDRLIDRLTITAPITVTNGLLLLSLIGPILSGVDSSALRLGAISFLTASWCIYEYDLRKVIREHGKMRSEIE